jgi:hypothetical protein
VVLNLLLQTTPMDLPSSHMLLLVALVSDNLRNCLKNLLLVSSSLGYGIKWKYVDFDDNHPKVFSCIDLGGDAIRLHGSHVIIY